MSKPIANCSSKLLGVTVMSTLPVAEIESSFTAPSICRRKPGFTVTPVTGLQLRAAGVEAELDLGRRRQAGQVEGEADVHPGPQPVAC